VFKGLWRELDEKGYSAEGVCKSISRRTTVPWPRNEIFESEIIRSNLYARRVAKYALNEYEKQSDGETPEDDFEIEHIYPQNPGDKWEAIEDPNELELMNSWGNLIPLSKTQNGTLGNAPYQKKVSAYAQSVFASARRIAQDYPAIWRVEHVKARNEAIAKWAVLRWPYERLSDF
jgi:hypothetical protein